MLAVSAVLPDTMPDHSPLILMPGSAHSTALGSQPTTSVWQGRHIGVSYCRDARSAQ